MKTDRSKKLEIKRRRWRLYNKIADTIGIVPNIRAEDNQFQFEFVFIFTILSILCGFLLLGYYGALGFFFVGIILGGMISGFILMIKGLTKYDTKQKQ